MNCNDDKNPPNSPIFYIIYKTFVDLLLMVNLYVNVLSALGKHGAAGYGVSIYLKELQELLHETLKLGFKNS